MPFDFLKRNKPEDAARVGRVRPRRPPAPRSPASGGGQADVRRSRPAAEQRSTPGPARGVPFIGLTEDWRLRGRMDISGRLSDALNKREAIPITEVSWGPPDGSTPLEEAPGLRSVDPYDLILVTAGEDSLPPLTDTERTALKVHKVAYDVALEVPPFRVVGTVYLHPGSEPDRLLDRSSEMFVAIVDAVARLGRHRGHRPRGRRDPGQPLLPAGRRAGRQAHGRAAPEAARRPAGWHQLAGPLALTVPVARRGRASGPSCSTSARRWSTRTGSGWPGRTGSGVQPLTFMAVLGAVIERGGDHLEPFRILRPGPRPRAAMPREREAAGAPDGNRVEDLYPDALDALRGPARRRATSSASRAISRSRRGDVRGDRLSPSTSSRRARAWASRSRIRRSSRRSRTGSA